MTENNDGQTPPPKDGEKKPQEIKVTVDNEQTRNLIDQLKREEKAREEAEKKLKEMTEEKMKLETEHKTVNEEKEDYKGKLEMIAEKELNKKREEIKVKAQKIIQDPERVKEIEAKLKDPEQVAATEYILKVLEDTLAKGEEAHAKILSEEKAKAEAAAKAAVSGGAPPAGSAPLNDAQTGTNKTGFDSAEAMVADLRKREHSSDPAVAAEAKTIIDELFKKWASAVKKEYSDMRDFKAQGTQPTIKELTKKKKDD